ncbi:MAG: hypothetical protein OH319_00200 [Candidatus Parvarchaeota archaeon]|nr:hypothetical protein [Candidatus Jingweiarchaeum tengchongense]MCW1298435.1 hypothetical protein [Candidatus Jingweiarchaeum tengchongense]MCW1300527.1 hypothetical protein [Candidatus Jingweiarchaeum tengchongense]MCW1304998.1 hypothetical protein [Candidatus Jingweiarchaeum tengchongense]MCW1306017.1 hypothetical protein [Candidatus Jingweiarchaeum tengchongense]
MSIGRHEVVKIRSKKFSFIFIKNEKKSARMIANEIEIAGENAILSMNVLFFKVKKPGKKNIITIAIN